MKGNSRRSVQLGDLITIKHGYAFKGEYFGSEGSHIVLTPGNFFDKGGFKNKGDKEKWYSGPIPEEYILSQGDLLVAMTEQAEGLLGSAAFVPKNGRYLHNQRLGLIQNLSGVDKRFLYYLFNSQPVRQQIRASCSGVKVRHTSPSRIYEVKVEIPTLPTQRKIAEILSAYDYLIENNLRRIKILEEMAQNLYREWFVKFRFPSFAKASEGKPGNQKICFVDSPMGKIPEGWELTTLDRIMDFQGGAQPPKNEWIYESQNGFVRMIQIRDYESDKYISFVKDSNNLQKCTAKDVMIARYGASVGRICFGIDGAYNVALVKVIPKKDIYREYLRAFLKDNFFQKMLLGMSGRTAQAGFNKSNLKSIRIVIPNDDGLFIKHYQLAEPIFESILNQNQRNQTLRRTRDLILPKLISGEVDASELDIAIPKDEEKQ